jgi:UDP-N-acetylmuramoyl-L-alanyl-D-glutamate--2,6-diaminopimelate ligase
MEILGLTMDSRLVKPGYLFAALPGESADGADYIEAAIEEGAVAILTGLNVATDVMGALHISKENPRKAFSKMASLFYKNQPKTIAAITGTNGKTSIADFARQLWKISGKNASSVGTLGVKSDGFCLPLGLTTPDPVALHELLASLNEQGTEFVGLEASSHGLEQHRLDGVDIKIAAFSNLTRDHLDYHGTLESYFAAKVRLFEELLPDDGVAVLNRDAAFGEDIFSHCQARGLKTITLGFKEADISIQKIDPMQEGQILSFSHDGKNYSLMLSLIGSFQAENALLAAGIVIASGEVPEDVFKALSRLEGVPGRMEFVGKTKKGGVVFIDYAHTPDGLRTALISARDHTPSNLNVVFGCGGDRDKGKRPEMGEIAERLSDNVFVTDDNPRSENPSQIRQEIMMAAPNAIECKDRASAIHKAVQSLENGDLLVVAGKGHEIGQAIGQKVFPFSDFDEVKNAIEESGS